MTEKSLDDRLIEAAGAGLTEEVWSLLDKGANVHAGWDCALQQAAGNGHVETVKLLLDHGADIHEKDDWALRFAAWKEQVPVVRLLLAAGADPHARYDEAFKDAKRNKHKDIEALLGAAVNGTMMCYDWWLPVIKDPAAIESLLLEAANEQARMSPASPNSANSDYRALLCP